MRRTDSLSHRRLDLSLLDFGKTDARYEVLTRDKKTKEHFRDSFLEPSGLTIDEFKDGSRFYVYGAKGAGKTALLRYVELEVEQSGCLTKFITFATDISEQERDRLTTDAGLEFLSQEADPGSNAVNIWLLYIMRVIARMIEADRRTFTSNRSTSNLCALVKSFFEGEDHDTLSWLGRMVKKGEYKVKSKYVEAKLQGEIGDREKIVRLATLIETCFEYLKDLSWEGARAIYIFFDELNLSFSSRAQHKRDMVLIRDLILAIDRFNSFLIKEEKQIYILAAARSEVIYGLSVPTHEVSKCLADRGRELRWFARSSGEKAPIVALFEKKVRSSERIHKRHITDDVLNEYFRRRIYGLDAASLIVELTWCNPRDIISLFGPASQVPDADYFDEKVLSKVIEEYSAKAWNEKVEELNVEFAATEIQSLKKILSSCAVFFKKKRFRNRYRTKGTDR